MPAPTGLQQRGQAIWAAYGADSLPASLSALVEETARTADRLDKLDALLAGRRDDWAFILTDDMGGVSLVIDKLLGEARQQQMAFKQLLMELRQAGLKPEMTKKTEDQPQGRGGIVDELRRRREARQSESAG
jgi:hypothetical protein